MAEIASIAEHIQRPSALRPMPKIEATQMKKLEFFQRQLDERKPQVFSATVVDVRQLRTDGRITRCPCYRSYPRVIAHGRLLCL